MTPQRITEICAARTAGTPLHVTDDEIMDLVAARQRFDDIVDYALSRMDRLDSDGTELLMLLSGIPLATVKAIRAMKDVTINDSPGVYENR